MVDGQLLTLYIMVDGGYLLTASLGPQVTPQMPKTRLSGEHVAAECRYATRNPEEVGAVGAPQPRTTAE